MLISAIQFIVTCLYIKREWPKEMIDLLLLLMGIIGLFLIVYEIIQIKSIKEINEYLKQPEYGIDYV